MGGHSRAAGRLLLSVPDHGQDGQAVTANNEIVEIRRNETTGPADVVWLAAMDDAEAAGDSEAVGRIGFRAQPDRAPLPTHATPGLPTRLSIGHLPLPGRRQQNRAVRRRPSVARDCIAALTAVTAALSPCTPRPAGLRRSRRVHCCCTPTQRSTARMSHL
jgi:hypothetical protein